MNRFITRRALGISLAICALALPAAASAHPQKAVCGQASAGYARCFAHVRTDFRGAPAASVAPAGYGPSTLQAAYALASASSSAGGSQTVAIVDAYDDPNAEKDLGVYRATYGLKACTSTNGCFRKVSQTGQSRYPRADNGWAQEISLDLDMVSAVCPNCHILLVEASSNSFQNLLTAEKYAASHATDVSNSWGGSEFSAESSYDSAFSHPGVPITASSGDSGFGVQWPAASPNVTAVGGTSLSAASNARGYTESAWSGAGSGCSAYELKPTWQTDTGCTRRTVADVSADADPNTGVSVYDTYIQNGWLVFGGTSVAAPVIASTYALAGNGQTAGLGFPYGHTSSLFDVTTGSNGSCSPGYLCTGGSGYDGPTGLGTPNGTGAF
jgi:subtilase family serine protease